MEAVHYNVRVGRGRDIGTGSGSRGIGGRDQTPTTSTDRQRPVPHRIGSGELARGARHHAGQDRKEKEDQGNDNAERPLAIST